MLLKLRLGNFYHSFTKNLMLINNFLTFFLEEAKIENSNFLKLNNYNGQPF